MQMNVCLSLAFRKAQAQINYSYIEFEVRMVVPSGIGLNGKDAASKMVILITLFDDTDFNEKILSCPWGLEVI